MTDRALTWGEWKAAMFEAYRDRVVAVIREIEDADYVHPRSYLMMQCWVGELKSAVADGDPARFDEWMQAIRSKLTLERQLADDDAVAGGGER